MITYIQNPAQSIAAIYAIWKRKNPRIYFPMIPEYYPVAGLYDYLNEWLFETGYISDLEYDNEYKDAAIISKSEAATMLTEMFSEVDGWICIRKNPEERV